MKFYTRIEVCDIHDEEKDTISFNERETDEIVVDHKNNQLNSWFIEALNHEIEKIRVVRKRKQDTKSNDNKFLLLYKKV